MCDQSGPVCLAALPGSWSQHLLIPQGEEGTGMGWCRTHLGAGHESLPAFALGSRFRHNGPGTGHMGALGNAAASTWLSHISPQQVKDGAQPRSQGSCSARVIWARGSRTGRAAPGARLRLLLRTHEVVRDRSRVGHNYAASPCSAQEAPVPWGPGPFCAGPLTAGPWLRSLQSAQAPQVRDRSHVGHDDKAPAPALLGRLGQHGPSQHSRPECE